MKISRDVIKALRSLGYRPMKPGGGGVPRPTILGKPVSTNLFMVTVYEDRLVWQNRFRTFTKGTIGLWQQKTFPLSKTPNLEALLNEIKAAEGYTHLTPQLPSHFEFLSTEESLSEDLE